MSPKREALEKEDRIDEMKIKKQQNKKKQQQKKKKKKKKKNSPHVLNQLQAQQVHTLPYAKVVGRPGTGSYPAPSPNPTTH